MQSETIGKLAKALSVAQGEMSHAVKDSINPAFRSKYADLAAVWDACRAQLSKYEIAVMQMGRPAPDGFVCVETILAHSSGEWASSYITLPVAQKTAHGYGSGITYGRRYGLAAAVGVYQDDDDANGAVSPAAISQGSSAAEIVAAVDAPAADTFEAVEELWDKAAILGASLSLNADDVVARYSDYKGKALTSRAHAVRYLSGKPDGKWVGMTIRKIEDAIKAAAAHETADDAAAFIAAT